MELDFSPKRHSTFYKVEWNANSKQILADYCKHTTYHEIISHMKLKYSASFAAISTPENVLCEDSRKLFQQRHFSYEKVLQNIYKFA